MCQLPLQILQVPSGICSGRGGTSQMLLYYAYVYTVAVELLTGEMCRLR
jgi:hypothetical protein